MVAAELAHWKHFQFHMPPLSQAGTLTLMVADQSQPDMSYYSATCGSVVGKNYSLVTLFEFGSPLSVVPNLQCRLGTRQFRQLWDCGWESIPEWPLQSKRGPGERLPLPPLHMYLLHEAPTPMHMGVPHTNAP